MSDTPTTYSATQVHELLRRSFAMRAQSYAHFLDVMSEHLGAARALELGKQATRRMGEQMGAGLAHLEPTDLVGLKDAFLGGIIEGDALFAPQLVQADEQALRIHFQRCPLKEAWEAMGRTPEQVRTLCELAGAIDGGLFESAGFRFAGTTWAVGDSGCCRLCVLPGNPDGRADAKSGNQAGA
ncbi:MAG: L-2-amino-thiazoline-4-carboxylic acid hydrolase [Burkholderiaceae bacterium]